VHADDEGLGRGGRGVGEHNVLKVICTRRKDRGTFVDLGGIKEIEDGEMLNLKYLVHALEAKSALAVEKVGNMGLLKTGLLGEAKSG